jgi:rod shape-determining protein MreD
MFSFKYIKENFLKSLPVILLYFLSFGSFEGIKSLPNFSVFSFNLQMIIIYFYILKYPDYLGIGHIFIAGLINDVVIGTPLGVSSLSYLAMCFVTSYIRNITLRSKMTAEWFTFIPAIFFSNLVFFIIVNNFSNLSFYYVEFLRNCFFTFLFFPFFYYLFKQHQSRFKED